MASGARQCLRCGRVTLPRDGVPARFCPVCGRRLDPTPVDVIPAVADRPARVSRLAILALVCGVLSIVIVEELTPGLLAVPLGLVARERIKDSDGRLWGSGAAMAGIVLGLIGIVLAAIAR